MPLLERLPLTPVTRQWPVWGTTARIVVTDPDVADAAQRLVADHLAAVDQACSRFREDSELAQVQRRLAADPGRPVAVSPLLADLIDAALLAASRTGGDVDPTLADDLSALGYDRDYALIQLPTTQLPATQVPTIQVPTIQVPTSSGPIPVRLTRRIRHRWTELRLEAGQVWMPAGVRLDLGASAKAVSADTAAAAVAARFGCGVLVALGGDLATAGPAPETGWQVLVQDGDREPPSRIRLDAAGLATSSTISRRWWNGTSAVHHILDPASGRPADPVWRTVSVAAPSCAEANAMSTAGVVRGWLAVPWLRSAAVAARLVSRHGEVVTSGGWPVR